MSDLNSSETIQLDTGLSAEDLARADLYGLLALMFYKAPDQALLEMIGSSSDVDQSSSTEATLLEQVWNPLVQLAKATPVKDWEDEYESNFIGVGKQEIFLYGSYYLTGFLHERPLVKLRNDLRELGLESSELVVETEDHIACLCEVMRYLIAGEDLSICNLPSQKQFFNDHLRPWVHQLFDVIENHPNIHLYRQLSLLTRSFFEIEGQAFDMV
jgi:TorA maturation chaperone TorD